MVRSQAWVNVLPDSEIRTHFDLLPKRLGAFRGGQRIQIEIERQVFLLGHFSLQYSKEPVESSGDFGEFRQNEEESRHLHAWKKLVYLWRYQRKWRSNQRLELDKRGAEKASLEKYGFGGEIQPQDDFGEDEGQRVLGDFRGQKLKFRNNKYPVDDTSDPSGGRSLSQRPHQDCPSDECQRNALDAKVRSRVCDHGWQQRGQWSCVGLLVLPSRETVLLKTLVFAGFQGNEGVPRSNDKLGSDLYSGV